MTGGGCRLAREADSLVLTPLPGDGGPEFTVQLRWAALPWQLPKPSHVEAVGEDSGVLSRRPVRREGEAFVVDCSPGVFCYRLVQD